MKKQRNTKQNTLKRPVRELNAEALNAVTGGDTTKKSDTSARGGWPDGSP
jgi:hypothetical protein